MDGLGNKLMIEGSNSSQTQSRRVETESFALQVWDLPRVRISFFVCLFVRLFVSFIVYFLAYCFLCLFIWFVEIRRL